MNKRTNLPACKRRFILLGCLAGLAMSGLACEPAAGDNLADIDEHAVIDVEKSDLSELETSDENSLELQGAGFAVNHETFTMKEDALPLSPGGLPVLPAQTTIRHDWGNRFGTQVLSLNTNTINRNSRVFVSTSEGDADNTMFIGSAFYTVHNVAPRDGGVDIRVHIGWNSPIRITVNYLIINP